MSDRLELEGAAARKDRVGRVEQYGAEYIPEDERHSAPKNLVTVLLGGSLTFSIIIIGWFPISFGLSWWQAASSVVVGSAFGAALLAPMGLMGPRSGTNNPVASGAFFGVAGRIIGSVLGGTAALAFAALSIWTGGDALAGALVRFFDLESTTGPRLIAYAVLSVVVTVISVYGHATMVAAQRLMIPTAGLCVLVGIVVYAPDFDAGYAGTGEYALGSVGATWMLSALICGSTVVSYGAFAGDWTRHISSKLHGDGSILRAMFIGGLFGMGGPFMWGTFTSAAIFAGGYASAETPYVLGLVDAAPLWFIPALVYMGLASGTAQAVINTYGTGLDTSAMIPKLSRVQATLVACSLATVLVYVGHFYSSIAVGVGVFVAVLACVTVPWIVMIAMGHWRRRGYYDVDDLQVFNRGLKGGVYWFWHGFNRPAIAVWSLSIAVALLFSSNSWFMGPGAALFGGADIGFLVGGVVAAVLYPLTLRFFPDPREVYRSEADAGAGSRSPEYDATLPA
jgi:purine-cytosine permease-like protein